MFTAPSRALARSLRGVLVALVLMVVLLVGAGCSSTGKRSASSPQERPLASGPSGALQEVPPPGGVQQLNARLNERSPRIALIAPADNSVIPAGPWTLQLRVDDWPLADGGALGLGPHLVVQLDDAAPQRITSAEAAAAVAMPELRPGSHRITVYAARPWGEAVKAPGAHLQLRLHRVSPNAAELPAPGSAQLIVASPDGAQPAEPVLVDWLLLDAPLQHLRDDDAHWRLRVSVNGDSFLVDRQTPLWLKGFRRGGNAVQLELLDGRGDPLNPPFNSVVREVVIGGGERPAWLRPSLNAEELAVLSGEAPASPAPVEPQPTLPEPAVEPEPAPKAELSEPLPAPPAAPQAPTAPEAADAPEATPEDGPQPGIAAPEAAPTPEPPPAAEALAEDEQPAPEPSPMDPTAPGPAIKDTIQASNPERLAPSTSLGASARDLVNADGSLQQPKPHGPLAGLREKLGG